MEGNIFKHWQISAAIVFSIVIITGAYITAHGVISPQVTHASTETELLKAIASKDSDSDGLPDWQESLYGTDPHNSDTFHLGMTDGEAVSRGLIVPKAITDIAVASSTKSASDIVDPSLPPAPKDGTLTAQFAQLFFTNFLSARQANGGVDLSESQLSDVAKQTMDTFTSTIKPAPDYKTLSDLNIVGSGAEAMKSFAIGAERILLTNTNDATTTDINYFKSGLIDGNDNAYDILLSIAKSYRGSAAGIAALPVPKELAKSSLDLINTLMRLSQIDVDFTKADTDPLVAILALQQYQTVVNAVAKAFVDVGGVFQAQNIAIPSGEPGALFANMAADVQRKQQQMKKP
jgi:hypothetical protein